MIEVRNLARTYGKKSTSFQALRGVSFQIPTGATAAIVGKSGSGKSTLMHLMGGLDKPSSGDIFIDGHPMSDMKRRVADKFRARDLGFVFQSFFIEANQTCYQNVVLPLEINRVSRSKRRALAEKALEQVELFDKAKAKAGTLSGGQKQRLAIARAIVHSPKIVLADEPTGNLDSVTGDKVIELLFDLNRRLQCTLIIVTHDPDLAARCQYQVEVRDGQVVGLRRPRPATAAAGPPAAGSRPLAPKRPLGGAMAPAAAPRLQPATTLRPVASAATAAATKVPSAQPATAPLMARRRSGPGKAKIQ